MNFDTAISERYEILEEIKRGGFGIIYRGLDKNFGRTLAIKAVDPSLLGEAKYIDMLKDEARSIARLNHHNIVQVLDIIHKEAGQLYIIMEYIDGPDLLKLLDSCKKRQKKLPLHLAAHIASEVCNGLYYAHQQVDSETNEPLNLVHQDISPGNIMLTRSGQVKVIDFGLATLQRQKTEKTNEVYIQGKIHYLAPEQVNDKQKIDRRTDIFALGLILFELVTGERLVKSNDTKKVLESLLAGNGALHSLDSTDLDDQLKETIGKALKLDPKHRYQDANQMQRDLMHYLAVTAPAVDSMSVLSNFIEEVTPPDEFAYSGESSYEETNDIPKSDKQDPKESFSRLVKVVELDDEIQLGDITQTRNEPVFKLTGTTSPGNTETLTSNTPSPDNQGEPETILSSVPPKDSEDTEDQTQKTIIDIVRLSARSHKKTVIISLLSTFISLLLFLALDTFAHFTPVGSNIYDFLFPPAIKIVSMPSGAQVSLDDKPLAQKTPLSIDKITAGVHKLVLTLPQFEPIVKSITVPGKGALRLSGEVEPSQRQPYVLRFKNQFEFSSEPAGADIIIDGVKIGQNTPATIFWDVNEKPTEISMAMPGIPMLEGLRINSTANKAEVDDRRLWQVDRKFPDKARYSIKGILHQQITLTSNPNHVDIYHNQSEGPIGVTGLTGTLKLPLGQHIITLQKDGYLPQTFTLDVNENTPMEISHDLFRTVRVFSKDATAVIDRDLGARIELSLRGQKVNYSGKTPATLQLLPYTYKVKLIKTGYQKISFKIPPSRTSIVAKMTPFYSRVTISVIDAITNIPINAAKVSYKRAKSQNSEKILGVTNSEGLLVGKIEFGLYEISISKDKYQFQKKISAFRAEQTQLTFRLTALR